MIVTPTTTWLLSLSPLTQISHSSTRHNLTLPASLKSYFGAFMICELWAHSCLIAASCHYHQHRLLPAPVINTSISSNTSHPAIQETVLLQASNPPSSPPHYSPLCPGLTLNLMQNVGVKWLQDHDHCSLHEKCASSVLMSLFDLRKDECSIRSF